MMNGITRRDFLKAMMVGSVAAGSAGLLSACGSSSSSSSTSSSSASSSSESTEASSSEAAGTGTAEVEEEASSGILATETLDNPNVHIYAYWEITDELILGAIEEFEQKYGGTVTVTVTGWNKGITTLQEAMATGDIPDLIYTEGNARFPQDAIDEYYAPIDEYLDYSIFDEASADAFLYNGSHYVFTNYAITSPYLIVYNKTIFEEEGLEDPVDLYNNGEWTYDKFLEYMDYFTRDTDGDGEIDQWGLGPRYKRQNFGYANDAYVVYEVGNGELAVGIDSDEVRQWYDFLAVFNNIDKNCPGDSGWLESRACVMYSEAGPSAGLSDDYTGSDEFDFVPLPTYDGRQATSPVWDNGYALVNGAPNPDGAAVLISMIGKALMDGYDDTLAAKYTDEQVERYYSIMTKTVPQRRSYPGISISVGESEALSGVPAQTIIETYKSQLEAEVAAYNESITNA